MFIIGATSIFQQFLSEWVDCNPCRYIGDGIDDIEYNNGFREWIGESKGDGEEDGEDSTLEEVDGEIDQRREKKLLRTLSCAKNEAEKRNQSEDLDKNVNIGSWGVLASNFAHAVLHNVLHTWLDLIDAANCP